MLYNILLKLGDQYKMMWKVEFYISAKTEYLKTDIESTQSSVLNFCNFYSIGLFSVLVW